MFHSGVCEVCKEGEGRYRCPGCHCRYCSAACYRDHSAACVDVFYKEQLNSNLRNVRADGDTKEAMVEILKRFHISDEVEEDGDHDCPPSPSRSLPQLLSKRTLETLKDTFSQSEEADGGDVGLEELRGMMSEHEFKAFREAALSGQLSHLLLEKEPWWRTRAALELRCGADGTSLVKEVGEQSEVAESLDILMPPLPSEAIPPLSRLSGKPPSPHLCWHLLDLLYSYCFVHRMRNGDFVCKEARRGAANEMQTLSSVLGQQGAGPTSARQAIAGCQERSRELFEGVQGGPVGVADDVAQVLHCGKAVVLTALEEIRGWMEAAGRRRLALKIKYFLSWANETGSLVAIDLA
mmetsp:Transcript_6278/g.21530  ORF Transcript_6278/g.21530 Transcript_6278/m.21530 type:complete len:351 (+) Transcript_6278:61-1113(+)